nr:MAG TPA: hypothetical protein [Caudoviricetes sp.]
MCICCRCCESLLSLPTWKGFAFLFVSVHVFFN